MVITIFPVFCLIRTNTNKKNNDRKKQNIKQWKRKNMIVHTNCLWFVGITLKSYL